MIRVEFCASKTDSSRLIGFTMTGHADYGEAQHDLLCATVSGIVTALINTLTEATDFGKNVRVRYAEGDVAVAIEEPLTEEQQKISQVLLNGFRLNMQELQKEYPGHINVSDRRL